MHVPAANIVLTFDVNAMIEFQNTKDLGVFKKYIKEREAQSEYKRETFIFTNSPNSSLLSLDHNLGNDGDSKIKIKLIDPENQLEKELLDTNLGDELTAENDPFGRKLEQLQQEKDLANNELARLKAEYNKIKFDKKKSVENLKNKEQQAKVQDKLDQILTEIDNVDDWNVDDYNQLMNSQLASQVNKISRAVYITYGVGTNLQDWSPPQCYAKILRYSYSFTGDGVRVLELELTGKGIHPNLTSMGLRPLGKEFLKGLSVKGVSQLRLFNEEGIEQALGRLEKYYKIDQEQRNLLEAKLKLPNRPPLHLPISEAVEDYIKNATGMKDNILCFMPDLDFYLAPYLQKCLSDSKYYTRSRNGIVKARFKVYDSKLAMLGYKKVMDGLGLKMCEVGSSSNKSAAIGKNVYKYIEECKSEDVVDEWFAQNDYRVMIQTDMMKLTFLEGLKALADSLKSKIAEFPAKDANGNAPPPMLWMSEPEVITDFNLIQIMFEKGIIENRRKPVIVWGDKNIVQKVLYGEIYQSSAKTRSVEKDDKDSEPPPPTEIQQYVEEKMLDWVSPFDVARGITVDFVRDVFDYYIPTSWVGAFGRQYNGANELDGFLPGDVNLQQSDQQKEESNPLMASRLPLFSFGSKYPNILSVDINGDKAFNAAITTAAPVGREQFASAPGIISDEFEGEANRMFDAMQNLDLEDVDPETDVPRGFEKLMDKYYDYDWPSGDDIQNFEQWQEVFNKLNPEKYSGMSDESFYRGGGLSSKQNFMKFMWERFSELYKYVRPTMDKSNQANDPSESVIANSVRNTQKLNEMALNGKIRTLPMFSLSSDRRVMNKACVVYCVEPRVYLSNRQTDNYGGNVTWFSGIYNMNGFAHTISQNSVGSTFYISRPGNKGLNSKQETELD